MNLSDRFKKNLKSLSKCTSEIQKETGQIDELVKKINNPANESPNNSQLFFQSISSIISLLPSSSILSQKYEQCITSFSTLNTSINSIFSMIEENNSQNKDKLSETTKSLNKISEKLTKITEQNESSSKYQHNIISIQDSNIINKFGKKIDKLNKEVEEYNKQKSDYDKEKEKCKDMIREIMEYKAKRDLVNEIFKGFDEMEEKLNEIEKKLKKNKNGLEKMYKFQVSLLN